MLYFRTKRDLGVVRQFADDVSKLWIFEGEAAQKLANEYFLLRTEREKAIIRVASKSPEYLSVRQKIAMIVDEVSEIAQRHGVSTRRTCFPPPAVGGPAIPVDIFYSVLHDLSYGGVEQQLVLDTINQTVGACVRDLKIEFLRMLNPFYWLKSLVVFIIRIPFWLISLSGFNVEKVEVHFLSRLFKLVELGIIIYVLIRLGLSDEELKEAIIKIINR